MTERDTLTQVVSLVQKDRTCFEKLYACVINKVYYWCFMVVKDEGVAHDLAQESMIKIYDKLHLLKKPETFLSWMYTLVRNICYDYLRSNRQSGYVFLEEETYLKNEMEESYTDHLPEDAYDLEETKKIIMGSIETLPIKQREVITLFYLDEFKISEIGKILNCSAGVVKTRLHNGRNNLETHINNYQKKHGTKLYSTILLPFLGAIMQGRRDALSQKQNFHYNQSQYPSTGSLKNNFLKQFLSATPVSVISVSLGILLLVGVGTFMAFNWDKGLEKSSSVKKVSALNQSKKDSVVGSITYEGFPSRTETEVRIHLKRDISTEKITLLFNEQGIPFDKKGKVVIITAKENGDYTLVLGKESKKFNVNLVDPYAPELLALQNEGAYLKLMTQDEKSQINYEASYMEYQGKQYEITKDQKVWGTFTGEVIIYLYNQTGQYKYYGFNLK